MIMQYRENGTRFYDHTLWEDRKNAPYDYERYGLVKHIMSSRITNTDNHMLKVMLEYYERSIVFLLKYVDRLKNFKNYHWNNR